MDRINSDGHFLAQIAHVILFGSYLRPEVDRLGDVDVAVELRPKEADRGRLRELNYQRAAELERNGHRFRPTLDRESWWQMETFRYLKGRSRSISLVDYQTEKEFVDQVPHKVLFAAPEARAKPAKESLTQVHRSRRPRQMCLSEN